MTAATTATRKGTNSGSFKKGHVFHPHGSRDRSPKAKVRGLKTLESLDQRTNTYKRALQLVADFENDLGGADNISSMQRQLVVHSAVVGALLEDDAATVLGGQPIDRMLYYAGINNQRRNLEALGLERRSRDVTPTLSDYLEQRSAAIEEDDDADGGSPPP
jgi:hypothetical protein